MPIKIMQKTEYREVIKFGNKTIDTNLIFLIKIFKRIKKGYSPLLLIVGKQRVGKSFIAVYISYIFMEMLSKEFNPKDISKFTFYDPIESIRRLNEKEKEPVIIDEAGSILTKREWYKKSHIALDKIIQTQGYKSNLYLFVSPFAIDIDKTFQKHFDFLIRVDDRGNFKVYQLFKKYDELRPERVIRRMFLEDVYVHKNAVPKKLWAAYSKYSIQQKENMRIDTIEKNTEIENPIERLKQRLVF